MSSPLILPLYSPGLISIADTSLNKVVAQSNFSDQNRKDKKYNADLIKEASRQRFFFSPLTLTLVTIELKPESILNRSGATWNTVSCNLPINIFLFSGFLNTSI